MLPERAFELLAIRRESTGGTPKKSTTKKTPAKKSAARTAPAKKAGARKRA